MKYLLILPIVKYLILAQTIPLFIYWNPSPDAIHFGLFAIKWYGILWGTGLMLCFFIEEYILKKLHRDDEKLTLAIQYIFIGGLIGARLAHIVFYNLDYYLANPVEIVEVWKGGLASHGGLVGGIIGLYLFCRRNKDYNFLWSLDMAAISVPILASLIRIGNLLNSELYGTPASVPWAFIFARVDNVPRHPVVLYEAIAYLLLQFIMLGLFSKYKESKPGIYISTLLIYLFTVRFLLEFFKVPDGAMLFHAISKTQALNVPFIVAGLIFAFYTLTRKVNYRAEIPNSKL